MSTGRVAERQTRPPEGRELPRLTVEEWRPVGPLVAAAFQAPRPPGRLEARPRPARRYTTATHGPRPTPEARLLGLLVALQTSPLPGVPGRWCGRGQSPAQPWLHGLLVALRRPLGDAPSRSVAEAATPRGWAAAAAPALGVPPEPLPAPAVPAPVPPPPGRA
jgi:hypothetical protein